MNKQDYIKNFLEEGIITAETFIKEREEMNEDVSDLPNDCTGVEIDGIICQNPDYKIDILTGNNHSIGYMTGLIETSKKMLMLNEFSDEEFDNFLIEEEKTRIHNDKVMSDLREYIKTKNPDLLNGDGSIG